MIVTASTEHFGDEVAVDLSHVQPWVIFTVGASASGKSTWAASFYTHFSLELPLYVSTRDNYRATVLYQNLCVSNFTWAKWRTLPAKSSETEVTRLQQEDIDAAIASKSNVIVADTNLRPRNFSVSLDKFRNAGYLVLFKHFFVDWDTAVERDRARANSVGVGVLSHQFKTIYQHTVKQLPQKTTNLIECVLCDIDGTIAHHAGRSPYDTAKAGNDLPDFPILSMLDGFEQNGFPVVFVTGRECIYKDLTIQWLHHIGRVIFPVVLYMRPEGDRRRDDVIKGELVNKIVTDGYYPVLAIDDCPRCLRKYRSLGIKTLTIGDPYIEF